MSERYDEHYDPDDPLYDPEDDDMTDQDRPGFLVELGVAWDDESDPDD